MATRRFLLAYRPLRHRFIFSLNGFGSLLNLLFPFRLGDIFRVAVLAKKKMGINVSLYFIAVERLIDLFVANSVFFILDLVRLDLDFSVLNLFGWIVGILGLLTFASANRIAYSKGKMSSFLINFQIIFPVRKLGEFCLSIAGSWILTACALLILENSNNGVIQEWISINSNFTDQLSSTLAPYGLLFSTLLIPLGLAYIYSLTIPSSIKLSRITLQEFLGSEESIVEIVPFKSSFGGSGSDLFIGSTFNPGSSSKMKYMIRVDYLSDMNQGSSKFMSEAPQVYGFPKVHYQRNFVSASCVISELIIDTQTSSPSMNAFEAISTGHVGLEVVNGILDLLVTSHAQVINPKDEKMNLDFRKDISQRILRSRAFVYLTVNHFSSKDRIRLNTYTEMTDQLISELDNLYPQILPGTCHGDATLTNFLIQETSEGGQIRSIDPNVRFPIANIEFDLAKVMQSTHALYDFLIVDPSKFPTDKEHFMAFQVDLGWSLYFDQALADETRLMNLNFDLLRFFFFLHLVRIVPYKVHTDSETLHSFLDLIGWLDELVDFR